MDLLQINIQLGENGADRTRLRTLSRDLYTSLHRARAFDARFLTITPEHDDKDPKGVVEFIPDMLAVSLGVSTSIARLSRILEAWITRDRYRSVQIENSKTEEKIDIRGLSAAEITQVLERWTREDNGND